MRLKEGDTLPGGGVVIETSNKTALVSTPDKIDVWREIRGYKKHNCIVTNLTKAVCLDCNTEHQIAGVDERAYPYIRLLMQFPDSCDSNNQKI